MVVQTTKARYETRPIRCWGKAKELKEYYYKRYAEQQGIRWAGTAWSFEALTAGLGDDLANLTTEPYAASIAFDSGFALRCMEATEAKGWARDLCSYLRIYFGAMYLDEYVGGRKDPRPDFLFQTQMSSTHSKWLQHVAEYKGVPFFCIDAAVGPATQMTENRINYLVAQMHEAIEWLQKVTGREFDDEKLIQAVHNECHITATWARICALNKAIPAPLDEKSMYSLYILAGLDKHAQFVVDFYDELLEEVEERVADRIAAIPNERCRLISDCIPPWSFLKLFRYLERYGAVSVGSIYTYGLLGIWEDQPDGTLGAARTPKELGVEMKTRDEALRVYADWALKRPDWQHFYDFEHKNELMIRMVKEWSANGVIIHYNRGCESSGLGIAENRLALMKAGIPVMTYEGNMADYREVDESRVLARVDAFMESLGFAKDF
ncbi:MAG: benzoyl-CoA reductase, bzd-type, subunit O [Chloroflexi bacterium]|nr:benzoyl-CoA reductase, bzd-type, subunit O [Chloroflexota bacterium]